jgi:hypothetical protein
MEMGRVKRNIYKDLILFIMPGFIRLQKAGALQNVMQVGWSDLGDAARQFFCHHHSLSHPLMGLKQVPQNTPGL